MSDGPNLLYNGVKTICSAWAKVLVEAKACEEVFCIKGEDVGGTLVIECGQDHGEESSHDEGITICSKLEFGIDIVVTDQPDLALAAAHNVTLNSLGIFERLELLAQVDDVAVALLPISQKFKVFH